MQSALVESKTLQDLEDNLRDSYANRTEGFLDELIGSYRDNLNPTGGSCD